MTALDCAEPIVVREGAFTRESRLVDEELFRTYSPGTVRRVI